MRIFLRSSVLGGLELRPCRERPSACPFRERGTNGTVSSGARIRCLAIERPDAAAEWLRAAVTHADDIAALRQLAADAAPPVASLSTYQVVDQVAQRIARHDLCLLVSEVKTHGSKIEPRPAPPPLATGVTPSMLRPRDESFVPARVLPPISELADNINHARQASALEDAARRGAAFCELCEKARQRQSAAGSAA